MVSVVGDHTGVQDADMQFFRYEPFHGMKIRVQLLSLDLQGVFRITVTATQQLLAARVEGYDDQQCYFAVEAKGQK
jgi:hypothetical protein